MSPDSVNTTVLTCAERLFSQHGYLGTDLDMIAAEVGVSVENMPLTKEDLLWYSALGIADAFHQALEDVMKVPRPVDDRLRHAIMAHINVMIENLAAANVYMHEWRFLSPERQLEYMDRRDVYETMFRDIIREGIHKGIFSPVDEKFVTLMLLSSLNWVSQWYREDGPMAPIDIAHTLADLTLNGIYRHV